MDRDTFSDAVLKRIKKTKLKSIDEETVKKNEKQSKNGIYFIYAEDKTTVIYVGKVGNGVKTSLAHRFYLHGSGAHCKKSWFQQYAKYYRFLPFPNISKDELALVERLMIYMNKQPIYNDQKTPNDYDFESLLKKL